MICGAVEGGDTGRDSVAIKHACELARVPLRSRTSAVWQKPTGTRHTKVDRDCLAFARADALEQFAFNDTLGPGVLQPGIKAIANDQVRRRYRAAIGDDNLERHRTADVGLVRALNRDFQHGTSLRQCRWRRGGSRRYGDGGSDRGGRSRNWNGRRLRNGLRGY